MLPSLITAPLLLGLIHAAPAPPPSQAVDRGASILERHVAVTGGSGAYSEFDYRVSSGTVHYKSANTISTLTIHETRSTDRRWHSRSEALGDQYEGSTGTAAWIFSDMSGCWLRRGPDLARALREAPIDAPASWRDHFERVEYVETREVDGRLLHAVTLTPEEGLPETRTYDAESGLHIHTECRIELEGNSVATLFTYSDYRRVDGVLLPHTIVQEHTGTPGLVIKLDRIVHEPELPDSLFEPPARVGALLE